MNGWLHDLLFRRLWGSSSISPDCTTYGTSQAALVVKNLPANAGNIRDVNLIPGMGRSPGKGHGNPLKYSCLENSMDRGAYHPWGCEESDTTEQLTLLRLDCFLGAPGIYQYE